MLDLSLSHSAGGNYESAIGNCVGDVLELFGGGENVRCPDRGTRLAKRRPVRIDHAQMREAEVTHGARGGANIERIARGNQHYTQTVEFRGEWRQAAILCHGSGQTAKRKSLNHEGHERPDPAVFSMTNSSTRWLCR